MNDTYTGPLNSFTELAMELGYLILQFLDENDMQITWKPKL